MVFVILKYAFVVIISIFAIVILGFHIGSGRPIKSIALNIGLSFLAVLILNITSRYTGVHIPVNVATVTSISIFGLPAVCTVLFLNIIFGLVL